MSSALHTVAETPQYLKDCAAAGMTDEERKAIVDSVAADPRQGVEIRGSGGVRKIRVAGRGKGDRANFSAAEIAGFKALTTAIGQFWRKG